MYHFTGYIPNASTGQPLKGALVKMFKSVDGSEQPLFQDESGTPAPLVMSDDNGKVDCWLPAGTYDVVYYYNGEPIATADKQQFVVDVSADVTQVASDLSAAQSDIAAVQSDVDIAIEAHPSRFGLVDDNYASDQTTKLQAWLTACASNKWTLNAPSLLRVRTTAAVTYAYGGDGRAPDILLGNLKIRTSASTGLIIGETGKTIAQCRIILPSIARETIDWSGSATDSKAGIVLHSPSWCDITRNGVDGFTKGFMIQTATLCTANTYRGGTAMDCKYGECLILTGPDGWMNDNIFNDLRVLYSSRIIGTTEPLFGTYIEALTGANGSMNSNRFNDYSYQMTDDSAGYEGDRTPCVTFVGCGAHNEWHRCRVEAQKGPFAVMDSKNLEGQASHNRFHFIYDEGTANQENRVENRRGALDNIYTGMRSKPMHWHSGPLNNILYSAGAGHASIQAPFVFKSIYEGSMRRTAPHPENLRSNIFGFHAEFGGPLVLIPTDKCKDFHFWASAQKGHEGRFFAVAFDENLAPMSPTVTDATGTENVVKFIGCTPAEISGRWYFTQPADNSAGLIAVSVRDEVKYLLAGYVAGTAPLVLASFGFTAYATYTDADNEKVHGGVGIIDPLPDGNRVADSAPGGGVHGRYAAGDFIGNTAVASGSPVGWHSTQNGSLGRPYANSLALTVRGEIVAIGGRCYWVKTAGVTASSGTGPTGEDTTVDYTDGTVVFRYLGPRALFSPGVNLP